MSLYDIYNYVIFENPISKGIGGVIGMGSPGQVPPQKITVITEKTPLWKLVTEQGPVLRIVGVVGASAVALGAYGSHKAYPKDRADELKTVFQTANRFHFFHTFALMGTPLCKNPKVSASLFLIGTTLFSGACYYHAFTGENKFGKLAPIGGTILIVAWLSMAL